jgi:hypothetical protein
MWLNLSLNFVFFQRLPHILCNHHHISCAATIRTKPPSGRAGNHQYKPWAQVIASMVRPFDVILQFSLNMQAQVRLSPSICLVLFKMNPQRILLCCMWSCIKDDILNPTLYVFSENNCFCSIIVFFLQITSSK